MREGRARARDEPQLRDLLAVLGERLGSEPALLAPDPGAPYRVGETPTHHVYVPLDAAGRAHIRREARRLAWAADQGIPVAPIEDADPEGRWLALRRVPRDPPRGPVFVEAATRAARAVARAEPPPGSVLEGSQTRRAPRWGLPLRALRLVLAGISLPEFGRARRRAARRRADTLAHGDFQANNLLFDAERGRVHLTDFEYLGWAPGGTDLLHLWCTLERPEDRRAILGAVLEDAGPEDRRRLADLHHWIAIRTLAEHVSGPAGQRDPVRLEEARRQAAEARRNAAAWRRA
jgi:hypothetical protein